MRRCGISRQAAIVRQARHAAKAADGSQDSASDSASEEEAMDEATWAQIDVRQTVLAIDNSVHELVPGGKNMAVPFSKACKARPLLVSVVIRHGRS